MQVIKVTFYIVMSIDKLIYLRDRIDKLNCYVAITVNRVHHSFDT